MGKELASVIIPVRDGGRFLAQAMESILAQTHERLELIVIDDGSTDDSPVVAGGYAARDPRVRFEYSRGRGIVEALETGLSLASGQWVARMDCDDIALPQRLEVQLAWMQRNGVDVCGSLVETFGAEQRLYWFPESHEAICRELVFRCALMHPSVVMRKAVLESEPYRGDSLFEDYDLWTRLADKFVMGNVQQVLLQHRRHGNQTQVKRRAGLLRSMAASRLRYVYSRYPDTPIEDYMALRRLCECLPAESPEEFERAGRWLVELADIPDRRVRTRMALRWKDHWTRSSGLGTQGDRIFFRYQSEFEDGFSYNGGSPTGKRREQVAERVEFDRVEVELTSACTLKCNQCNRSCGRAPDCEIMTPKQFERFIEHSLELSRHWKVITLMGGEPTLHKGLEQFYTIAMRYKREYDCVVELATNGYGAHARNAIQRAPQWVLVRDTGKTGPMQMFTPFCAAPCDLREHAETDFSCGCRIPRLHGLGFSRYGLYPCGPGASIDRVFGLGVAIHDLSLVTPQRLKEQRRELCALCGHFSGTAADPSGIMTSVPHESVSWQKAYRAYSLEPPALRLYMAGEHLQDAGEGK